MKRWLIVVFALLLSAGCSANDGDTPRSGTQPGGSAAVNDGGSGGAGSGDINSGMPDNGGGGNGSAGGGPDGTNAGGDPDETGNAAKTAEEAAAAAVSALQAGDMAALEPLVHPVKGVLFSPYAHIDEATALTFRQEELPDPAGDKLYTWGSYDGSGEPITLTFREYWSRFVYDKSYAEPDKTGKDEIVGQGNTLVNIKEVFPDSRIADYYIAGTDAQSADMDWASLILVLEPHEGAWYVSAIVHNQWTI